MRGQRGRARSQQVDSAPRSASVAAWAARCGPFLAALGAALLLLALAPAPRAGGPRRAAAASESPLATSEALRVMQSGGNAIDAAIVAALVAGVTSPTSSGIGGGGFATVWLAAERRAVVLDFRETAPLGVDAAALAERPRPPEKRGQWVGVPGEVAGLFELCRRYGSRPWAALVAPAERLAREGYPVGRFLATSLAARQQELASVPGLGLYFPGGNPASFGARLTNPALARTLARIASEGPRGFYEGPVAGDLVETVQRAGGALTLEDLARYRPVERAPLEQAWNGYEVHTVPPPSAGGLMLVEALGVFAEPSELRKLAPSGGLYQHLLAEAFRGALADRLRYVGDPAFTPIPLWRLLSAEALAERRRRIRPDRTHPVVDWLGEEHGTHALVTADEAGNAVSLTTTVNNLFGAELVAEASGVVLNDQLDDFTPRSLTASFGVTETPNQARGGARPTSSMTPTVVTRGGRAVLALGGSGGMMIATNVSELTLRWLLHQTPVERLVEAPRFSVPLRGATLALPPGAPESLRRDLERRGEVVETQSFLTSAVQALTLDPLRAAADPRKHGAAEVSH